MGNEYYHTDESVEEYIRLAKGYDGSQLIEKLKDFLPVGSALLEMGSGPGTDWEILNSDFQVVGSDNSFEFIKRLRAKYPHVDFLVLDAITLTTDKKFDGIYSNKVLHHLKDGELDASIKRQHEILTPNGIICHSFWEGEGSEVFKGLFVNYHAAKTLRKFFEQYFEIVLIEAYQEFDNNDSVLLIAQKKTS